MRVLTGSAYGGGSIVYGGLLVRPREELFDRIFPPSLRYQDMQPYYDTVADMLGIGTVPEDIYGTDFFTHYRVMEEQNDRAGLATAEIQSASDWDRDGFE